MNFKEGDKIRMTEDCGGSGFPNKGDICTLKYGNQFGNDTDRLYAHGDAECACICRHLWELVEEEITWDTLKVNDELKDKDGDIRTVLGVCGRVIFTSWLNQPNSSWDGFTKEQLIDEGISIVQPSKPCCDNCDNCKKCNK